MEFVVIFPNGKSGNIVHKNQNNNVHQCINIGDKYGTTLFRKLAANTHNI